MRLNPDEAKRQRLLEKLDRLAPADWQDLTGHLRRLTVEAKRRHRSILGIHEVDPRQGATGHETLKQFGYEGYEAVAWDTLHAVPESGTGNDSDDGATTVILRDVAGNLRSAIVIRRRPDRSVALDGLGIAVLLHECGHVDDFEKGKFLIPGRKNIDFVEVENYAHRYACKRMIAGNFRFSLSQYLMALEDQLVNADDFVMRTAARRFLASGEFRNALQFCRYMYDLAREDSPKPTPIEFPTPGQ